jgi:hypothetical protein
VPGNGRVDHAYLVSSQREWRRENSEKREIRVMMMARDVKKFAHERVRDCQIRDLKGVLKGKFVWDS